MARAFATAFLAGRAEEAQNLLADPAGGPLHQVTGDVTHSWANSPARITSSRRTSTRRWVFGYRSKRKVRDGNDVSVEIQTGEMLVDTTTDGHRVTMFTFAHQNDTVTTPGVSLIPQPVPP